MGLGPHCSPLPTGPVGLDEVEMEWKADCEPGRAVPLCSRPCFLPQQPRSPGDGGIHVHHHLWGWAPSLTKPTALSVSLAMGGLRDGPVSYRGAAGGHLRT